MAWLRQKVVSKLTVFETICRWDGDFTILFFSRCLACFTAWISDGSICQRNKISHHGNPYPIPTNVHVEKKPKIWMVRSGLLIKLNYRKVNEGPSDSRGGDTLGISGWGWAARTLEPLPYTRATFSWILVPYTRVNSPNHSYPRQLMFIFLSHNSWFTQSL